MNVGSAGAASGAGSPTGQGLGGSSAGAGGVAGSNGLGGGGLVGNEDLPQCNGTGPIYHDSDDCCVGGCAADASHQCAPGLVCCYHYCTRDCLPHPKNGICEPDAFIPCQQPKDCAPGGTAPLTTAKLNLKCDIPP
jgi:hypothetical protein